MDLEKLVSILGQPKVDILRKIAKTGMDKRGLEMFLNHNIVAARFSGKDSIVATWCCSSTPFIHLYNTIVDTQFRQETDKLPPITKEGLLLRRRDKVKSWNLLSNSYCDIPLDKEFTILNFEPIDLGNADSLNKIAEKLVAHMRAGFTEVKP